MPRPENQNAEHQPVKPAFTEFYESTTRKSRNWLLKCFRHRGLTEAEADEIVSDVAVEVARRYETLEHPNAYFYRCLRRRANRYLAGMTRERYALDRFVEELEWHRVREERIAELLARAARVLTQRERRFLELAYLFPEPNLGRPYRLRELAHLWGCSYDYMREYAAKVHAKLRGGPKPRRRIKAA